jgi:SPP1 family phage portal protein
MEQVKQMKTLRVGEDGDARAETIQIPVEAREKLLNILNDKIFLFGQGVDINKVGDGNITNVVIKSRYANLDLKADDFEGQIEDFFEQLLYFVNYWHAMNGLTVYDDVTVVLDRSMIINSNELMDTLKNQKGIVSDVTIWENHPLVADVEQEIDRMKEQETIDLDNIGADTDESDL